MPILATIPLPPPSDEKEFEIMTLDYCNSIFGPSELYGRRGQAQNGIDVITFKSGKTIGIQCKNYQNTIINEQSIDSMIAIAETFNPPLDIFVIATTARKDAHIQKYVYSITKDRAADQKFPVILIYWDEISNYIKSNMNLLEKYYPQFPKIHLNDNRLITSADSLKNVFSECIAKYQVFDFLNDDPFLRIRSDLPVEIDCFIIEVRSILNKAFMCQTKKVINI